MAENKGPLSRLKEKASQWMWRHGSYESPAEPIVVGGCPRSGTTLTRVILDTHSRICCGPEARLFSHELDPQKKKVLAERFELNLEDLEAKMEASDSLAQFIDEFFADYCKRKGKARWAEKTPKNIFHLDFLFKHFPKARFIHVIRDGRDVACSMRKFSDQKYEDGEVVVKESGKRKPIRKYIKRWVDAVMCGLAYQGDPRCFELKYEALVTEPEKSLRPLFEFLGEPWEPAVLEFHKVEDASRDPKNFPRSALATQPVFTSSLEKWKQDMDTEDVATVKKIAGPLLIELGYAKDNDWS